MSRLVVLVAAAAALCSPLAAYAGCQEKCTNDFMSCTQTCADRTCVTRCESQMTRCGGRCTEKPKEPRVKQKCYTKSGQPAPCTDPTKG
ncbi:MAG: hypothetical protein ACYC8T_18390 [Myxococcaceae bacterium]